MSCGQAIKANAAMSKYGIGAPFACAASRRRYATTAVPASASQHKAGKSASNATENKWDRDAKDQRIAQAVRER